MNKTEELKTDVLSLVTALKSSIEKKEMKREIILAQIASAEEEQNGLGINNLEKAVILINRLEKRQREKACDTIEKLCTYALQYAMGDKYRAKIKLKEYRGKAAAEFFVLKGDMTEEDGENPIDSNGGGVVDMISNALRIVFLQSFTPFIDGPILLDEPYKQVSEEYVESVYKFLEKISTDFKRQLIIATHENSFKAAPDPEIAETGIKKTLMRFSLSEGGDTVVESNTF